MAFDLEAFDQDVQARLRTVAGLRLVATADDFRDAIERAANLPAVFTMYKGSRSQGRLVQGNRRQLRSPLKLFIALVTQSLVNRDKGHVAIYSLLQPVENVLVGYTPVGALSPFIFAGDYFVLREGPKIVYGAEFQTKALDFTT